MTGQRRRAWVGVWLFAPQILIPVDGSVVLDIRITLGSAGNGGVCEFSRVSERPGLLRAARYPMQALSRATGVEPM